MRQTTVQDICFAPIYTFIYFGGGLRDVRTDKVARIGQKTASGAKVTTFTLKWGVLAKKPPSDQNASKNHVYVGLSTFSFLDPPRISFGLFESRRNKLDTPSVLQNFGAKFSSSIRP